MGPEIPYPWKGTWDKRYPAPQKRHETRDHPPPVWDFKLHKSSYRWRIIFSIKTNEIFVRSESKSMVNWLNVRSIMIGRINGTYSRWRDSHYGGGISVWVGEKRLPSGRCFCTGSSSWTSACGEVCVWGVCSLWQWRYSCIHGILSYFNLRFTYSDTL